MAIVCAIYGYEFTHEFAYNKMRFLPSYTSLPEANQKARDLKCYHLTGVVVLDSYDNHEIFCLEAVLSFIEHLDVMISDPITVIDSEFFKPFPSIARTTERHSGFGAVLHQDSFFHDMRSGFIQLAMSKLVDKNTPDYTGWRTLFFKSTVPFRQRPAYIDVSYFLLFSGLETYVRQTLNVFDSSISLSLLISKRLKELEFNIFDYRSNDLKRSTDTYVRLRNSLFHNSSLEATRQSSNGEIVTYKLFDYYVNFQILVNLVVLKAAGFDHPRFHWDAWITMQ
jgi:hypothetical protein